MLIFLGLKEIYRKFPKRIFLSFSWFLGLIPRLLFLVYLVLLSFLISESLVVLISLES